MTIINTGNNVYLGLSTDTKPTTGIPAGSRFVETDTGISYVWNGTSWITEDTTTLAQTLTNKTLDAELNTLKNLYNLYSYIFYPSGGSYKSKKVSTGVTTTNADFQTLLAAAVSDLSTTGGRFGFVDGKYIINSFTQIPKATQGAIKPFIFEGIRVSIRGSGGTYFEIGPSFPDQRYIFESVSAGGSNTTSSFDIRNIYVSNVHYAKNADGVHNLDGNTSPLIDAGLVNFESDISNAMACTFMLENVAIQYLWRGIYLAGYIFWPIIKNFSTNDLNTTFQGDTPLLFANGTGHPDRVKGAHLENIRIGALSTGTTNFNAAIMLCGGYHKLYNAFVDGGRYNECVVGLKQCFSTSIYSLQTIDLPSPGNVPSTFKGVFLFDSTSPDGQAGATSYWCYNNQVYDISASASPYSIAFRNGAFRNYIKIYGYWGNNVTIDDAAAGSNNDIVILSGQALVATADVKITSSNGIVKIIDTRPGAASRGLSATQSGDGATTVFNVAHGCFASPAYVMVQPATADARGTPSLSATATNIVITYPIAPPSGTNNLQWYFNAEVYS